MEFRRLRVSRRLAPNVDKESAESILLLARDLVRLKLIPPPTFNFIFPFLICTTTFYKFVLNMASDASSFSCTQFTTQESSRSRSTKWRSPVWDYCRTAREEDDETSEFLYCFHCGLNGFKKPYGSNLPTNMKKHLLSVHSIIVEKGIGKIQAEVV
ncbi:hypothetical protein F5884DRAFT_809657 [Xylogone sp. PMI_703]|nr:hypothetical protein F5884DRAFT_809657 [Xylogone sp. PMI_703]